QARIATVRALSSASVANLDVDPELSVLLALAAVSQSGAEVLPEAEEALHRGVQAHRLQVQVPSAAAAFFSPDGEHFIGGGPGDVPVWDAATGEEVLTLVGHTDQVFNAVYSPDGAFIGTNSFDGTTRLWNATTGEELWRIEIEGSDPLSIAISPDSQLLATSSQDVVRVWEIASQELTATLDHFRPLGINFGPNGLLAVADDGSPPSVRVWDVATRELVVELLMPDGATDVAFAPDGSFLAVAAASEGQIFDTETWELQNRLFGHVDAPQGIDVDPTSTLVASGANDGTARIFDAATGRPLLTLVGHDASVINVAFSPDGLRIATGGTDDTTRVWDIGPAAGAEWLSVPAPAGDVDYSPDGGSIAASSFWAAIHDAATGQEVLSFEGHEDFVRRIQFSEDGSQVATASFDGSARIWNVSTGEEQLLIPGFSGSVDFSPDGTRLATGGETHVRIFDANTGQELLAVEAYERQEFFEGPGLADVEFSPDGKWFATSGFNGWIKLWDAEDGTLVWEREGHTGFNPVSLQIDFSSDGSMLASVSWDGTAQIWDPETGDVIRTLGTGAGGELWAVDFSPDGRLLATGGGDGDVTLWDVEEGVKRLTLGSHPITVFGVDFSPDGRRLATGSFDDTLRVYVVDVSELAAIAQERLTRWWTEEECLQYLQPTDCPPAPADSGF
ncbi:MAG: WD40 repeat domain-containing protein, partial [Acidimicrobiia bacterium]